MRPILFVLLVACPALAVAQGPPIGAGPTRSEIRWDARATGGATFGRLRIIGDPDRYLWAGTLGFGGGVSYRGRPHGGVSLKAALDVSYPDVPTLLNLAVGFNYYPFIGSPTFVRFSAGPTIFFAPAVDLGIGGEIELHARRTGQIGLVALVGGFYRQRDNPFNELWGVRASVGVAWGHRVR